MHIAPNSWQGRLLVVDIDLDAFGRSLPGDPLDALDDMERERAGRMATPLLRRRFVAAHAAKRIILASALGADAASLSFATGQHGKPSLATARNPGLHFNLSHCQGRALLAVSDAEVGVDIEAWIERDTARLAGDVLSNAELARFGEFQPEVQPRELARLWAAKEALVKACGVGLQLSPEHVAIEADPGWHRLPAPADFQDWWLQRLDVEGAFCAFAATARRLEATVVRFPGPGE